MQKHLDIKLRELLSHPDKSVRDYADQILKKLLKEHEQDMYLDNFKRDHTGAN